MMRAYSNSPKQWLYKAGVLLIVFVSFYFYAPCRFFLFNSDQAVHVMMLKHFNWPHDAYYWGQNRLGSFLPLVTWPFYKLLPFHPLVTISLIHYVLLFVSWYLLAGLLRSDLGRLVLCVAMFLPLSSYYYFILIGHPYEAQLFCLCVSVFSFNKVRLLLLSEQTGVRLFVWHFIAIQFGVLAYWVSEFSALVFLFAGIYAWLCKPLRARLLEGLLWKNKSAGALILLSVLYLGIGFFAIRDLKQNLTTDALYDQLFITQGSDIRKEFGYLSRQTLDTLGFKDPRAFFENAFYACLVILVPWSIWLLRKLPDNRQVLMKSILWSILAGCVLLFFSSWNYHSFFGAKYFSILYVLIFIPVLASAECMKPPLLRGISGVLLICMLGSGYLFCFRHVGEPTVFERYGNIKQIRKGTLVCDYWNCYAMNAVAFDSLQSFPMEAWSQRNSHQLEQLKQSDFFYFFDDANLPHKSTKDTVHYFGFDMVRTGTVYPIQGQSLMQYRKLK